jgi:hypothetical protein
MADDALLLEYLLGCSETSMQNVLLNKLNDARNRQKELTELLERWAEVRAEALLFEWFGKHGPELMARVTRTQTITELQRLAEPEKPGPQRLEDFRESLKNLLESA